tara:strand:+ start:2228 stop:2659 length:432 start_codon:yes stop_codon:yes gene_type:complete
LITALGTIFLSKSTGKVMLGLRSESSTFSGTWSFWGGKLENTEYFGETLDRELEEELGKISGVQNTYALDDYESKDGKFKYASYVTIVNDEFIPTLNSEHVGYCWVEVDKWPKPLHNGARIILENKFNKKKIKQLVELYSNLD